MFNLAKEIIQTNIDVWGESFLINGMLISLAVGTVVTFILIKRK